MRILNRSSVPTATVKTIVDFVGYGLQLDRALPLRIQDRGDGSHSTGEACARAEGDETIPEDVNIWVGNAGFPRTDDYCYPQLSCVKLSSLEEELVLVIAHELRHVHQFSTGAYFRLNAFQMELDAESFARGALTRWRENQVQERARAKPRKTHIDGVAVAA
jgi:hypothetical protein